MSLVGKREFLGDEIPFLLGRYPDRPAPTHVVNGLLISAFGEGPHATLVRELLRAEQVASPPSALAPSIRTQPERFEAFRNAARLIFDPDAKVFPSVGSPFPVHLGALARDPSDDGFGREVWMLLARHRRDAAEVLERLYRVDEPSDAIWAFADAICENHRGELRDAYGEGLAERASFGGPVGEQFALTLCDLALRPAAKPQHRSRSLRIAAMTRGVFASAFLAALRAAEFSVHAPKGWQELAPMFVLGDVPPGRTGSPEVRLAARSFEQLVGTQRNALAEKLASRISRRRIRAPERQFTTVLLSTAFSLRRQTLQEAAELLGASRNRDVIARRLLSAIYPAGHLERGFRSMGAKIGLAGPDRGTGAPRFLFETPILALVVDASLGECERMPYEDWLDRLYERFGFICGRGKASDYEAVLRSLDARGPISRALDANHEALRRRMIRAGLAVEYSDSETEVVRATT